MNLWVAISLAAAGTAALGLAAFKNRQRRMDLWLPAYLRDAASRSRKKPAPRRNTPVHLMFVFADHYEPGNGNVPPERMEERVGYWLNRYPEFASRFRDADGRPPRHTWFYPPHYPLRHVRQLGKLCYEGFGEIEFHLHHGRDTSQGLREKLVSALAAYPCHGALITAEETPRIRYGFIHGNWALDNADEALCGVNDELTILRETGCYADYTMPSCERAQSRTINRIYYAPDDPDAPRSYDAGIEARNGTPGPEALMLIPGILGINLRHKPYPRIENSSITSDNPGTRERIDYWVRNSLYVPGRSEWRFIKMHAHGAVERDWAAIIGEKAEAMHRHLTTRYNDGNRYVLHYVTAREAYNIIKAAEAGLGGNPDRFRDYTVPPYLNTRVDCSHPYEKVSYGNDGIFCRVAPGAGDIVRIRLKDYLLKRIEGAIASLDYREIEGSHIELTVERMGEGKDLHLEFQSSVPLDSPGESLRLIEQAAGRCRYKGSFKTPRTKNRFLVKFIV